MPLCNKMTDNAATVISSIPLILFPLSERFGLFPLEANYNLHCTLQSRKHTGTDCGLETLRCCLTHTFSKFAPQLRQLWFGRLVQFAFLASHSISQHWRVYLCKLRQNDPKSFAAPSFYSKLFLHKLMWNEVLVKEFFISFQLRSSESDKMRQWLNQISFTGRPQDPNLRIPHP